MLEAALDNKRLTRKEDCVIIGTDLTAAHFQLNLVQLAICGKGDGKISPIIKRFAFTMLYVSVITGGIFGYVYYKDTKYIQIQIEVQEEFKHVQLQARTISDKFRDIAGNLLFLSEQHELISLIEESTDHSPKDLAQDYISFSQKERLYDQIRYIDKNGMEIVRVNYNNGNPVLTPKSQLQNKSNRYYFENTIKLSKGEVYVSPFDLNLEQGKVEAPLKPMIRFGTPVFDSDGNKHGIIMLNFFGSLLLENLKKVSINSLGEVSLLNKEGYWLMSPNANDEWGFMFGSKKDKTFSNIYKDTWQNISKEESGQFYTEDGLFTFATIYPLKGFYEENHPNLNTPGGYLNISEIKNYQWKTVSRITPEILNKKTSEILLNYLQFYLALMATLGFFSWFLARNSIRRAEAEEALRKANHELKLLSSLDGLTGIANRRSFDEFIEREWRRSLRDKQSLSLILIDIDYFKKYNDGYGHLAGDDCLKQVVIAIARNINRAGDLFARYGGEEFGIVLGKTDANTAVSLAEKVRSSVETMKVPHAYSDSYGIVTLSIGVACVTPNSGLTHEKLIEAADKALYMAKEEGRNRVKLANESRS